MILPTGWYVYLSPDPTSSQTDIHGPFDTCLDLVLWMGEHKIRLEADRKPPKSAPRLVSEMTDGEAGPIIGFGIHLRT